MEDGIFFSIFEWEKKKKKRRRSRRRGGWVDRKTAKHGKRGKLPLADLRSADRVEIVPMATVRRLDLSLGVCLCESM